MKLEDVLKKVRAALEFYSDKDRFHENPNNWAESVLDDRGERAKGALAALDSVPIEYNDELSKILWNTPTLGGPFTIGDEFKPEPSAVTKAPAK